MIKKLRTCGTPFEQGIQDNGFRVGQGSWTKDRTPWTRSRARDPTERMPRQPKRAAITDWSSSNSFDEKNEFDTNLPRPPAWAVEPSPCGAEIELNCPG